MFPLAYGQGIGQIVIPDSIATNNYFIRALTKYQLNFDMAGLFTVPVFVRNNERPYRKFHKRKIKLPDYSAAGLVNEQQHIQLITDTLNTSPEAYNSWNIKIDDTMRYAVSVSVTDADRTASSPLDISSLKRPTTENLKNMIEEADTSYISFSGRASTASGKNIMDKSSRDILLAGVKDSSILFTRVVTMDDQGDFQVDSMFFFGDINLRFQINKPGDGSAKDIRLNLWKFIPPAADSSTFSVRWADDSSFIDRSDTLVSANGRSVSDFSQVKTLKAVTVNAWKSTRKELDKKYASGAFSEPALYSYDIRTEKKFNDLGSYLRSNFSRFQGGFSPSDTPRDLMKHPFLFYVDEQNYTWPELAIFDWERIAYIKCFESDFIGDDPFTRTKNNMPKGFTLGGTNPPKDPQDNNLQESNEPPDPQDINLHGRNTPQGLNSHESNTPPNPNGPTSLGPAGLKVATDKTPVIIAIYTRKGTDFRTMPGGLNYIIVSGYSEILRFTPNKTTLYWKPDFYGNDFRIQFTNNENTRRFRLIIEGIDYKGQIVHFEKILEVP